ncbi:MAG: hypothetical protein LBF58_06705 [Deltaproteobacteria bacterium]|jgi:hypothetical protein|nr:hypothetical protein [Deltaproteobacteria bacterium]
MPKKYQLRTNDYFFKRKGSGWGIVKGRDHGKRWDAPRLRWRVIPGDTEKRFPMVRSSQGRVFCHKNHPGPSFDRLARDTKTPFFLFLQHLVKVLVTGRKGWYFSRGHYPSKQTLSRKTRPSRFGDFFRWAGFFAAKDIPKDIPLGPFNPPARGAD